MERRFGCSIGVEEEPDQDDMEEVDVILRGPMERWRGTPREHWLS